MEGQGPVGSPSLHRPHHRFTAQTHPLIACKKSLPPNSPAPEPPAPKVPAVELTAQAPAPGGGGGRRMGSTRQRPRHPACARLTGRCRINHHSPKPRSPRRTAQGRHPQPRWTRCSRPPPPPGLEARCSPVGHGSGAARRRAAAGGSWPSTGGRGSGRVPSLRAAVRAPQPVGQWQPHHATASPAARGPLPPAPNALPAAHTLPPDPGQLPPRPKQATPCRSTPSLRHSCCTPPTLSPVRPAGSLAV